MFYLAVHYPEGLDTLWHRIMASVYLSLVFLLYQPSSPLSINVSHFMMTYNNHKHQIKSGLMMKDRQSNNNDNNNKAGFGALLNNNERTFLSLMTIEYFGKSLVTLSLLAIVMSFAQVTL